MFAVTITLVIIILSVSLVSLATPSWTVKNNSSSTPGPAPTGIFTDTKIGLWQACDKKCIAIDNKDVSGMLKTSRAFAVLTALFSLLSLVCICTIAISQWHSEVFLRLFLMFASMSSLITLITYGIYRSNLSRVVRNNTQLGYSYYIQLIVLILTFIATEISFYHPKL